MASLLVIGAFNLKLHECFLIDDRFYKAFPVIHLQLFLCSQVKWEVVLLLKWEVVLLLKWEVVLLSKANNIICQVSLLYILAFHGIPWAQGHHTLCQEYASSIKAVLTLFQS